MFSPKPKTSMPISSMIDGAITASEKARQDLLNGEANLKLFPIYKACVQAMIDYCAEEPDSPAAKMFNNLDARNGMKIFATPAVKANKDFFYVKDVKRTYGWCKTFFKIGMELKSTLRSDVVKLEAIAAKLHTDLKTSQVISQPQVDAKVLDVAVFEVEGLVALSDIELHVSNREKYLSMKSSNCMIMEYRIVYPSDDVNYPSFIQLSQKQYFYLFNESENEGRWYEDGTGEGNKDDFQRVCHKKRFMTMYENKAQFLTVQYRKHVTRAFAAEGK